jgi:hypothetical protein
MPVHNHTFAGSGSARIQVGNHSHTFSASVTGGGGAVSGYTGSGQAHQHSLNGSGYNTVMVYGTPRSVSVVMDPFATNQATVLNTADGVTTTSLTTSESSHTHSFSGSGGGGGSVSGSTNSTGGFDQSATVSVSGNTGNKGGNVAVDNKPPFCEMIFLMKL